VEIRYVESGEEPSEFCQLFPKWNPHCRPGTDHNPPPSLPNRLCVEFDPNKITSDESLDEKFDKTGRPLDSLPVRKGRYSDGARHTRHQSQPQPQEQQARPQSLQRPETTSTKEQSESLFKVTLKHHPPTATAAAAAGTGAGGESSEHVPEFVTKRNALRAVKCPDTPPGEPTTESTPSASSSSATKEVVESTEQHPKKTHGEASHHRSSTTATTVLSAEESSSGPDSPNRSSRRDEETPPAPISSVALVQAPLRGSAACCVVM
jgi:hypothetical protein